MNCSVFADQWNIWAENLLFCSGNSRNPVISCSGHMLSMKQANTSTEKGNHRTSTLPSLKKADCIQVNSSKQLSGPAWNNMRRRPLAKNFFLLRSAGSLSWHSLCPICCPSSSEYFQEDLFYHTHFSNSEVSHEQNGRTPCFWPWLLACPACRNHGGAHWGGRLLFSTQSKVWSFGSAGVILVRGLHRWSVSAVCLTSLGCLTMQNQCMCSRFDTCQIL